MGFGRIPSDRGDPSFYEKIGLLPALRGDPDLVVSALIFVYFKTVVIFGSSVPNHEAGCAILRDLNFDTIKRLWGRQWFSNLVRVQFIITFILHYISDEGIVFIRQKDNRLVRQYRHKTTVRNMILQLIKIGVLYDLQTHYSYGSKGVAKYYYANQISLNNLVSYYHSECKERGVKPDAITFLNCPEADTAPESQRVEPLKKFRGFNSIMSIDMAKHSMEQIKTKLYEKYPIQYYQEKAHSSALIKQFY